MTHLRTRTGRAIGVLAVLVLVLAACGGDATDDGADTGGATGGGDSSPTEQAASGDACENPETTELRLATSPPEFDTLTDAYWLQSLEDAGFSVETFEFESSPDTVRAVASGEGDLINTSPLAIMQFIQQSGGGLEVLAVELLKTDYLLVSQPEIESLEDLRDKIIGISTPGDLSDSLTRLVLEEAGVGVEGIEFAEIGGTSARVAALGAGQIAAGAAHYADALAAMQEFDLGSVAEYAEYIPDYAQRFLAGSPQWIQDNPNATQCVVDKMIEAQRWAQENKDAYLALAQETVEGIPADIAEKTYDYFASLGFFGVNGGLDKIEPTMEVEVNQGNLDPEVLAPPSEWVNPTFVEDYLERNGEFSG